jgi:uncharacterized protein YbaP (TraB family)
MSSVTNVSCSSSFDPNNDKGIVYAIKNKEGKVFSYIIGTLHCTTREMAHHPRFLKIIDQCKNLYSEAGAWGLFNDAPRFTSSDKIEARKKLKYSYCLDDSLAIHALHKKIPVFHLDGLQAGQISKSKWDDKEEDYIHHNGIEMFEEVAQNRSCMSSSSLDEEDLKWVNDHAQWALGNGVEIPKGMEENVIRRNHEWADILIPVLQENTSTCIAVGAAHLSGEESLPQLLRNSGFTVEQMLEAQSCPFIGG